MTHSGVHCELPEGLLHTSQNVHSTPLPQGFRTHEASDADEHAANLTGWRQLYDQLTPGKFHGSISELWAGSLQVFCEVTSHTVRQSCVVKPDSWWFGIPLRGPLGHIGNSCIEEDAIAARPGGTEFELLTPDDFHFLGVVVTQQELSDYIRTTEHMSLPLSLSSKELLYVGRPGRGALQTFLQQVLREASNNPHLLQHQASRQAIQCSVLHALSEICCRPRPSGRVSSTHVSRRTLVGRVKEYVLYRRDEPVTISELCRTFYVSRRTLQNAFHHVVGMGPAAYLRVLRLNGARRMLRDGNSPVVAVQDAAAAWGFWHLSQFACDYRRMFGELPSDTLRQRANLRRIH